MDLKKTGSLIAQQRKAKNLTQRELAEQLGVTDKAISRWETGTGFPDVSILVQLSNALDLTITEIVNGERAISPGSSDDSDRVILSVFDYIKSTRQSLFSVVMAIVGVFLLISPLFVLGANNFALMACGTAALALSVMMYFAQKQRSALRYRIIALFLLLVSFILECVPGAAVLIFASGPHERMTEYVSCFDMMLLGYANAAPFLSAVLTVISLLLTVLLFFRFSRRLKNTVYIITILAAAFMPLPALFFGFAYYPPMAIVITICLATSSWFQACANATTKK